MAEYLVPLLILVALFVGFGLLHGNGKGARGCAGCTGCSDPSECRKDDRNETDASAKS
jgi:hypothetical protein